MHPYSIDTDERVRVTAWMSILSIILFHIIRYILNKLNISFPDIIGGPSLMGIFGFFYWVFDNYAWKWKLFRRIHLVKTPILEGVWCGEYYSKRRCQETNKIIETEGEVELTIKQNWTTISVIQENESSKSCSEVAGIATNDNMGVVLNYQYRNEAKNKNVETMHSHIGFNKLYYSPEKQILEGNYFTDKSRQTYGTVCYEKNRTASVKCQT